MPNLTHVVTVVYDVQQSTGNGSGTARLGVPYGNTTLRWKAYRVLDIYNIETATGELPRVK